MYDKTKDIFLNLKNNYFLRNIFSDLPEMKALEIVKYNKYLKQRLNLDINNYKDFSEKYSSIVLEIIPNNTKGSKFININNKEDESYFHIFFDDKREEVKTCFLNEDDKVTKITINIDYKINSFSKLFKKCNQIESISFKKFCRNNILNMSRMFCGCSFLKEINFSNFNTKNVTDMDFMFHECTSLKELELSIFKTENVKYMDGMFYECSLLKKINISNFNTVNVISMQCMFHNCSSLEKLNLNNFNTDKVKYFNHMFENCLSLKEINVSNFNLENACYCYSMFNGCPEDIKIKVKSQIKNIEKDAFLSREELGF